MMNKYDRADKLIEKGISEMGGTDITEYTYFQGPWTTYINHFVDNVPVPVGRVFWQNSSAKVFTGILSKENVIRENNEYIEYRITDKTLVENKDKNVLTF